jgi:hypothetical protein
VRASPSLRCALRHIWLLTLNFAAAAGRLQAVGQRPPALPKHNRPAAEEPEDEPRPALDPAASASARRAWRHRRGGWSCTAGELRGPAGVCLPCARGLHPSPGDAAMGFVSRPLRHAAVHGHPSVGAAADAECARGGAACAGSKAGVWLGDVEPSVGAQLCVSTLRFRFHL